MHDQPGQLLAERAELRKIHRAVMAITLAEFPKQLKRSDLSFRFAPREPWPEAVAELAVAGLLWCEGEVVLPPLAARHFDWLEQG